MTRQIPHASLDLIVNMSLAEYLGNSRPYNEGESGQFCRTNAVALTKQGELHEFIFND